MIGNCVKYSVTNACGHVKADLYKHCGRHNNTRALNDECNNEDEERAVENIGVRVGTDYCNRGCEAKVVGWRCCTCSFKSVSGFYHSAVGMLVHEARNGDLHGFCTKCLTENEYMIAPTGIETAVYQGMCSIKDGAVVSTESIMDIPHLDLEGRDNPNHNDDGDHTGSDDEDDNPDDDDDDWTSAVDDDRDDDDDAHDDDGFDTSNVAVMMNDLKNLMITMADSMKGPLNFIPAGPIETVNSSFIVSAVM